jgi:predicted DCC family thiol-disulfide oxidoreductase YuxK
MLTAAGGLWTVPGVVMRVPPVSWVAHGVYRLVADNRQRMPGGTAACMLPADRRPGAQG